MLDSNKKRKIIMAGTRSFGQRQQGDFMTATEDPSLKARKAAALSLGAATMKEKAEGVGGLIAGVAPTVLGAVADVVVPGSGAVVKPVAEAITGAVDTSEADAAEAQRLAQEAENQMAAAEGRQPRQISNYATSSKATGKKLAGLGSMLMGSFNSPVSTVSSTGVEKAGLQEGMDSVKKMSQFTA